MDKIIQSQVIYEEPDILRLEQHELKSDKNKGYYIRVCVRVPDAVAVLALNADNQYVLVRQPRIAVNEPRLIEMIAGKIDANESPQMAAVRETEEETGMRVKFLHPLGYYYSSPAYLSERIHLFFAYVEDGGTRSGDDLDSVAPTTVDVDMLNTAIIAGEIHDGKLLAALGARQILLGDL